MTAQPVPLMPRHGYAASSPDHVVGIEEQAFKRAAAAPTRGGAQQDWLGKDMGMEQNRFNPLHVGNSEEIARRIVDLMPEAPEMTPEQAAAFEKEREEGRARYQKARFGELPADTYRVLDYGSFLGWYYALEVGGEEIVLQESGEDFRNKFKVHGDAALANQLAKAEIAQRYGAEAAERARFAVVWGGTL